MRCAEKAGAAKRNQALEVYPDASDKGLEWMTREPSPEEAALFVEELEALLHGMREPEPEIIRMCLDGHTSPEIAAAIGCSRWTVRRVLSRIGERLRERNKE